MIILPSKSEKDNTNGGKELSDSKKTKRKVKLSQNPKECFCKKYQAVSDIFTRSYFILRGLESRNLEFFN